MRVYLSSTYLDLKKHRQTLGKALRKAGYVVVMMEEYPSRAGTVEFECQGDVLGSDVYVGIVARRYGFAPETDNPEVKSITELEYEAAMRIPRLGFLLEENARWPDEWKDADRTRVDRFRARWQRELMPGYFRSATDLPAEVMAALRKEESTRFTRQLEAVKVIHEAQQFGPSYLMNVKEQIGAMQEDGFPEFQIGPIPWWNTRLHLVAALAEEFGRNQEFVFADKDRRFLAMAPAGQVRKRLAVNEPRLESVYQAFRKRGETLAALGECLWRYPEDVGTVYGRPEQEVVVLLTEMQLKYDLGLVRNAETVEEGGKKEILRLQEILGRPTPYVALLREGRFEGRVVDTGKLARAVARVALG